MLGNLKRWAWMPRAGPGRSRESSYLCILIRNLSHRGSVHHNGATGRHAIARHPIVIAAESDLMWLSGSGTGIGDKHSLSR